MNNTVRKCRHIKPVHSRTAMPLKPYNRIQILLFKKFNIKEGSPLFYKLSEIYNLFRTYELTYTIIKAMIKLTKEEIEYQKRIIYRKAYLRWLDGKSEGAEADWSWSERTFFQEYYENEIKKYNCSI